MVNQMTRVYEKLKLGIKQIEEGLGINQLDDEEIFNNIEKYQITAKAYVLLVHAELEKYFEILSVMIAKDSFFEFDIHKNPTLPLLSLASTNLYVIKGYKNKDSDIDFKTRVKGFFTRYIALVKENNGIKAKNVSELFWMLGLSKDAIGDDLLSLLDSYGIKRGAIAHTGKLGNEQLLNIKEEEKSVRQLINEIEKFDLCIEKSGYITGKENIDEIEAIIFSYQGTPNEDECDLQN